MSFPPDSRCCNLSSLLALVFVCAVLLGRVCSFLCKFRPTRLSRVDSCEQERCVDKYDRAQYYHYEYEEEQEHWIADLETDSGEGILADWLIGKRLLPADRPSSAATTLYSGTEIEVRSGLGGRTREGERTRARVGGRIRSRANGGGGG